MNICIKNLNIKSIATCVPQNVFEVESLKDQYDEKRIKRIIKSTGIKRMRITTTTTTASDLCFKAAEKLFETTDKNEIDSIIFISNTPDYISPPTSCVLQHRLGLSENIVAFDINYGCSGYIYGIFQAALLINSGSCKKVLLCAGSADSKLVNKKDKALSAVVGDAGSATIIEKGEIDFSFSIKTFGSGYKSLIVEAGGSRLTSTKDTFIELEDEDGNIRHKNNFFMNGLDIMNFALKEVPIIINDVLKEVQWSKDEVELFAFHQPNKLILDYLKKIIKIEDEKMPIGLELYGNTSTTAIPLLLSDKYGNHENTTSIDKLIMCGFGVGLSAGAIALSLKDTKIYPPFSYEI